MSWTKDSIRAPPANIRLCLSYLYILRADRGKRCSRFSVCRQLGLRYYWAHLPARMGPGPKRGPRTLYRDHFANMLKIEQKDNTAEPKIRLGEDSAEGPLVDVTSSTGIYRQS